ncbi:hypothetical protein EBB79_00650 [Parasedimentitalea marina]|uniref:Uncharacterized protein n=1 Tax=Parasedimentitalea marina TaxID=2483033 RepID=A0A3T0MXQ0_9RHOB|nr:hypothetical protein [Parasedimentitalea marina]AZV76545.1 hypothetical protein EBB79_00650 [Parasedimentitalea marina]
MSKNKIALCVFGCVLILVGLEKVTRFTRLDFLSTGIFELGMYFQLLLVLAGIVIFVGVVFDPIRKFFKGHCFRIWNVYREKKVANND